VEPGPTVYVVDDDPAVLKAVTEAVELMGLTPESHCSADQFLEAYRARRPTGPACLILNVTMPGTSGLELQAQLRAAGISLPVIIITGHADVRMAVRAMKAGAVDFLEKPFRTEELSTSIRAAIALDDEDRQRREA
jgi:FixJ family two-component response regulator